MKIAMKQKREEKKTLYTAFELKNVRWCECRRWKMWKLFFIVFFRCLFHYSFRRSRCCIVSVYPETAQANNLMKIFASLRWFYWCLMKMGRLISIARHSILHCMSFASNQFISTHWVILSRWPSIMCSHLFKVENFSTNRRRKIVHNWFRLAHRWLPINNVLFNLNHCVNFRSISCIVEMVFGRNRRPISHHSINHL